MYEELKNAIALRDICTVERILSSSRFDPNYKDAEGDTPMHWAMEEDGDMGSPQGKIIIIVNMLIKKGVPCDNSNNSGFTPLLILCDSYIGCRNSDVGELLIQNSANVNYQDDRTYRATPLHNAVIDFDEKLVKILLKNNADIHLTDNTGNTPYDLAKKCAASKKFEKILKEFQPWVKTHPNNITSADNKLVNKKVEVISNEFIEELSDLVIAIGKGDIEKVEDMLENGVTTKKYIDTIFTFAISKGHKDIVEYLINKMLFIKK